MNNRNLQKNFDPIRIIKKIFLSAFVVITFVVYALHKPANSSDGKLGLSASANDGTTPQTLTPVTPSAAPTDPPLADTAAATIPPAPTDTAVPQQVFVPTATSVPPTAAPNTANQNGQYKDGTYTGPEVDAIYGLVQVQAVIQNGKISNVQFLEYPNDRRTSVRINSFAVPTLQQEAVQAQSANVNLITGATLTSEAFQMSLQTALNKAKGTL